MSQKNAALLEGYRVLDLTDERGHLCGKILGDLGADVVKIEPPGGDPGRNNPPFFHDMPHPEKSLYWFWANLNKRGITLDIKSKDGRELFKQLIENADIVVESFKPGYMESLGLGYDDLEKINPGIIVTSITPFGQTGPYAHYEASDLVGVSMGGMAILYGYSDSSPFRFSAPQFYFNGSLQGVVGTMTALYHKEFSGEGQHVDVSCQQAVALTLMVAAEIWDLLGINTRGSGPFGKVARPTPPGPIHNRRIWSCKDGYVLFLIGGGAALGLRLSIERIVAWANREGYALVLKDRDWLAMDSSKITQEEVHVNEAAIGEFFLTKTKSELFDYALENDIMLVPIMDIKDLVESPQLRHRKYWVEVNHPELEETILYPGWPIKWTDVSPYTPQRRSPLIGEHNKDIYGKELGITDERLVLLKARGVI